MSERALEKKKQSETTWFIMKKWRVRKKMYSKLCLGLLILSLFFERFFFISTVYKTKYFGYVLILVVIALNCLFNMILYRMREQKQTKKMHELFHIEHVPKVNGCVIGCVGMLDMLYAFFLFWPANVIPVWSLLIML